MRKDTFEELFERVFETSEVGEGSGSPKRHGHRNRARFRPQTFRSSSPRGAPRKYLQILVIVCLLTVLATGMFALAFHDQGAASRTTQKARFRAAIVDELSTTMPDPEFVTTVTDQLTRAGFRVDYYGPDRATVGLFHALPSMSYGLIVFRAHTAWSSSSGISIITSEPYTSDKYVVEQLTDEVERAAVYRGQDYFAVTSRFVRDSMQGRFPGSMIIVMGCDGLAGTEMAQSFLARGASAYASWSGLVTLHTDVATLALIQSIAQGRTLRQAVDAAMAQAGPDPTTHSTMGYYDSSIRNYQEFMVSLRMASVLALVALALLGPAVVLAVPRVLGRR